MEEKQIENEQNETAVGMQPVGEALFETDVQMTSGALYDYLLKHTYSTPMGLIGTIIGVILIMFFAKGAGVIYLICGIVVILYLPWSLYLTAKRQAMSEAFKKPLHYAFFENGVEVSQGEIRQMQGWDEMFKAINSGKSIILYTGKNKASIFPNKDLGEKRTALIQVISAHMEPKKVKIKQ